MTSSNYSSLVRIDGEMSVGGGQKPTTHTHFALIFLPWGEKILFFDKKGGRQDARPAMGDDGGWNVPDRDLRLLEGNP